MHIIHDDALGKIRKVMLALYKEDRMTGDDMRDFAQTLDAALQSAWKMPDETEDKFWTIL